MIPEDIRHTHRCTLSAFVLMGVVLLLSYSNSFDASWHLDDYQSIIGNESIHIEGSADGAVLDFIAGLIGQDRFDRPFAFFTFALNWYWGQDDPGGYHLVNFIIHFLAAFLIYRTLVVLFKTPRLTGTLEPEDVQFVAMLAALLWALNPIQVSAVTYIVQRMASLCALFYIIAIYLYICARLSDRRFCQVLRFSGCLVSFFLAISTKENALLLPFCLLLVEAVFFLNLDSRSVHRRLLIISAVSGLALFLVGFFLFLNSSFQDVFSVYDKRYFTPIERLLTQPRVLFFYLSLIFYPSPTRLSLVHDIAVSTSLVSPWTTLVSLVLLIGIIGWALFQLRRRPLLSFAVLFFFLNHVIESSIIPLELIFEHRNYLPSMFLFWPVAFGIVRLMTVYREKSRLLYGALAVFIPLLLIGLGTGTYIRNIAWSSEQLLWEDAIRKAPQSARPYNQLAWSYFERHGDQNAALYLYHEALKRRFNRKGQQAKILNNIANIYFQNGDCQRAIEYWRQSHEVASTFYVPHYRLALALTRCGRYDEALGHVESVIGKAPEFSRALNLKGIIRLIQGQPREALALFRQCLQHEPDNRRYQINTGAGFYYLGDHQRAKLYLQKSPHRSPDDRIDLLWNSLNDFAMGEQDAVDSALEKLIGQLPVDDLRLWLRKGFEARLYRSEIIFPEPDPQLMAHLVKIYGKRVTNFAGFTVSFPNSEVQAEGPSDSP